MMANDEHFHHMIQITYNQIIIFLGFNLTILIIGNTVAKSVVPMPVPKNNATVRATIVTTKTSVTI